jgi:hypothetical protein
MNKNEFQHVRSGEPLVIHAAAYNAMLDAAQAHRNRNINLTQHKNGFESLFIHVVNETNISLKRFSVVGLEEPIGTNNIDNICNRIIFKGVIPQKKHLDKFAILQQDASPNMIVRACTFGITIAQIEIPSNFNAEHAQLKFCDIKEGETANLIFGGHTEVLWHNADNLAVPNSVHWGIIRIGSGQSILFPVKLQQNGGEQGNDQKVASWEYDVVDALTNETLEKNVNPTIEPHQWKRPGIGAYTAATFGYAHFDNDNKLVLGWINETPELAACTTYV